MCVGERRVVEIIVAVDTKAIVTASGGVEGGRGSVRWRGRVVEVVVAVDVKVVVAMNGGVEGGRESVRWGGACDAAGTAIREKCALGMGAATGREREGEGVCVGEGTLGVVCQVTKTRWPHQHCACRKCAPVNSWICLSNFKIF